MQRARRPLASPASRVWLLTGALALIGALLSMAERSSGPIDGGGSLSWWTLILPFLLSELIVVHLHFRRDSNTIALSEIPLVVGLFLASPLALVAGRLAGALPVLAIHRRQGPLKLCFNLASLGVETLVAALVLRTLVDVGTPLVPRGWVGTFTAVGACSAISCVAVTGAISLAQGVNRLPSIAHSIGFTVVAAVANGALGLLAVRLVRDDAPSVALLVVPVGALFAGYRIYVVERHRSQRAEFLNRVSGLLERPSGVVGAAPDILALVRDMFQCELAVFEAPAEDASATRILAEESTPMDKAEAVMAHARATVERGGARVVVLTQRRQFFGIIRPTSTGLAAAVLDAGRHVGTLVVAERNPGAAGYGEDDIRLLETVASQLGVALENDRLARTLRHRASRDALTGLANRDLLVERIEAAVVRRQPGGAVAVLFLDLDDFKTVNDSLGHSAGDALLMLVGRRLAGCSRAADTAARLGGDEFALLVELMHGAAEATSIAERICTALLEPFEVMGHAVAVRGSIGVAIVDDERPARGADELLRDADLAMYGAKTRGKGVIEVFAPAMHKAVFERHRLKEDLRRALEQDQLLVLYQPIIDMRKGTVRGAEALVRWRHPERGLVSPGEFIPLAEELGLIQPLGRRVLEAACRELAVWKRPDLTMSVNISALQLEEEPFGWLVEAMIGRYGLNPEQLTLEVTETVMNDDSPRKRSTLAELRALGVSIALDDFGTGYSSLASLRDLPIDIIKLAKPFVDHIDEDERHLAFASAICRLADTLGMRMVAEGVERTGQAACLRRLGCEMAQGFLYSRAVEGRVLRAMAEERIAS